MGLLLIAVAVLASPAGAQTAAGLTGVVRDTTGAVLPGVAVEAASPALIEKVRTAVTDGQGRFNITDIRPGVYSVTFTLAGFSTVRLEGIPVSAGFTGTANAELSVGGLAETMVVTGASSTVDIQNTRRQQVLTSDVLAALPAGQRDLMQIASLTLGARSNTGNDVGGALGEVNTGISIHGSLPNDSRFNYDGLNINHGSDVGGGAARGWRVNTIAVAETVVDTGTASADTETGAANVNAIPRDGGNRMSVYGIATYSNRRLASGKVPQDLIARGNAAQSKTMKQVYDYGLGIGGPVIKDRLWFYNANRIWDSQAYGANNYFNKSPVFYRYEPDLSRPAYTDVWARDVGVRFTTQVTAKHKVASSLNWQQNCGCWLSVTLGGGTPNSPEASTGLRYGPGLGQWLSQTSWSYPATNRLLFQAAASFLLQSVVFGGHGTPPGPVGFIMDAQTGIGWGAIPGGDQGAYGIRNHWGTNSQLASMSYVTGSHQLKIGLQMRQSKFERYGDAFPNGWNSIYFAGVPNSIRQFASPFLTDPLVRTEAIFAQDQWTINRLTLSLGGRYDHAHAFASAVTVQAGPFKPQQSFPELRNLPNFHDISPRLGAAFDVFGNAKTAIKVAWGKYPIGVGTGHAAGLAPSGAIVRSSTRTWGDANGNYLPDCDLTNFGDNGECGGLQNRDLGRPIAVTTWESDASTGWGVREFSYQYSITVQHEIRQGLSATIAYNRNDIRNQQAIVNDAVTPADFTPYCITAPTDSRLGRVSGQRVCGLYDVNPGKVGLVQERRVRLTDIQGRTGRPKEIFNGVDLAVDLRYGRGGLVMGGVTVGRSATNRCWLNDLPHVQEVAIGTGTVISSFPRTAEFCEVSPGWWDGVGSQVKIQAVYPLPGEFVISGSYKQLPGITIAALYQATNTIVRTSDPDGLKRDLSACLGRTPCTSLAPVQLAPSSSQGTGTLYDSRVNEVDMKLTRAFRVGSGRIQGIVELYNVFNVRPAQGISSTYGPTWLRPTQLLGGRLLKFGTQIDF